jgi:hypothetical protein
MAPGETAQLGVNGILSDGSTRDLTSQAKWTSRYGWVLSVEDSGRVRAERSGDSVISAHAASMMSTTEIVVVPPGTFRLAVIPREAGSIFLDVRVDVVQGTGAGLSATGLVDGRYSLYGVSGDTLIRVSGRGYEDRMQRVVVTEHTVIEVEMAPARVRPQISGDYTLTITPEAGRCGALPPDLRIRRYAAQVSQLGPEVWATLDNPGAPAGSLIGNRFGGRLSDDNATITFGLALVRNYYYYYFDTFPVPPDVVERLSGTTYLLISGGAVVTVRGSSLSGTLRGVLQTVEMPTLWKVTRVIDSCSTDFAFTMTR